MSPRLALILCGTPPLDKHRSGAPASGSVHGQRAVAASHKRRASARFVLSDVRRSRSALATDLGGRPPWRSLWPSTLTKFWGWHALSWGVASLSFAFARRATAVVATGYAIALAAANFALAVLLYRNAEELASRYPPPVARTSPARWHCCARPARLLDRR